MKFAEVLENTLRRLKKVEVDVEKKANTDKEENPKLILADLLEKTAEHLINKNG